MNGYGGYALVTGASSGLGAEFARQLASAGVPCVLVARRAGRLSDLAQEITKACPVDVRCIAQDLTSDDACERIGKATADLEIGLLVNNAGFGDAGRFHTRSPERMIDMVKLNCVAPVALTRRYAPAMVERGRGGIIFVSSALALVSCPNEAVYSATKAFDLALGEALWGELRSRRIDVLTVCPAGTATEFARVEGFSEAQIASFAKNDEPASRVVERALSSLGRRPVTMARDARALSLLHRLLPRSWSVRLLQGLTPHLAR
jgi:uncharacterized protein